MRRVTLALVTLLAVGLLAIGCRSGAGETDRAESLASSSAAPSATPRCAQLVVIQAPPTVGVAKDGKVYLQGTACIMAGWGSWAAVSKDGRYHNITSITEGAGHRWKAAITAEPGDTIVYLQGDGECASNLLGKTDVGQDEMLIPVHCQPIGSTVSVVHK